MFMRESSKIWRQGEHCTFAFRNNNIGWQGISERGEMIKYIDGKCNVTETLFLQTTL